MRPTWTCLPRLRKQAIDEAQVAGLPTQSREMRAAVGERADLGRSVGHHSSVDSRRRAEPTGERSSVRREVYRDHLRARRDREHHRRDPGAAATVHGDPLTRSHVSLPQQCTERGGEPAAERRRVHRAQILRQGNQIRLGIVDRDEFRE